MATYIATLRFTEKGIQAIKDTTKRAAAFTKDAKKLGVKVSNVYWTLGPFDGVMIFEADDDPTATAAMLALASRGNVHTSTARAFVAEEMDEVLRAMRK
jgi:uncharacterized protein with GYD domain